jgi:hypothetical protein
MVGHFDIAARLAGFARAVHPSVGTRTGSRKIVVERLDELLASGLPRETLIQTQAEGGRWSARTAADLALLMLRDRAPAVGTA